MDGDGPRVRAAPPDPYAVLNLDPARADDEAVRRAYRAGSRALHPDRQPPGRREAARRAFVELKRARDVLADPVARFAHDERGARGTELVRFLERRRAAAAAAAGADDNGADDDRETLWTLGALLARGDREAARRELTGRARRTACLRESGAAPTTTTTTECNAEFRCDAADGLGAWRADQVAASLTVDLAPTLGPASSSSSSGVVRPRSVRVGASGTVRDGSVRAGGRATIEFEPAPGSDVKIDCDAGSEAVSVSTTRTTTTGTVFTVGATTPWTRRTEDSDGGPTKQRQKRPLSLNFTTHRLLFGRTVHGLFTVGAGTDRTFHYSRLSLTTLRPDRPRCALTLGLGLGVDRFPLRLSITQRPKRRAAVDAKGRRSDGSNAAAADATDDDRRDDDDDPSSLDDLVARRTAVPRARRLSLRLGLGGAWEVGGSVERVLPPLARSTAGLRWNHAGEMVVTLGLRTTTGASLTVPVTVARSTAATTATTAIASLVRWTAWTWAVDAVVADALADALRERLSSLENAPTTTTTASTRREGGDASSGATALIARRAAASRRKQRDKTNGLVVTRATYGRDTDVTDRLQFWVSSTTSTLTLPASVPKERALFLEEDEVPRRPGVKTSRRPWRSTPTTAPPPPPIELTVRYEHEGYAYEITVGEADALVLPPTSNNGRDHRRATLLGRSDVVS